MLKMAKTVKSKKALYYFLTLVFIVVFPFAVVGAAGLENRGGTSKGLGQFVPVPDVMPVVVVSGTPAEMGYQYGYQAAAYVQEVVDAMWDAALRKLGSKHSVERYLKRYEDELHQALPGFATNVIEQMRGIAMGCRAAGHDISYTDILLINNKCAILWALPPKEELGGGCGMFAAWGSATKDGKPIAGHNRDNDVWLWHYEVVLLSYPAEGYGYSSISCATAGSGIAEVWFMNEKGLTQLVTAGVGFRPKDIGFGVTYEWVPWYVAQNCATTKEAIDFIVGTKKTMGVNYGYLDENGNVANAETTYDFNHVRYPGDYGETDYINSTALHFIIPEAQAGYGRATRVGSAAYLRYFTFRELIEQQYFGKIDVGAVKKVLSNHDVYDPDAKTWNRDNPWNSSAPCNHSRRGSGTISSTITLPQDRTTYVCSGSPCGVWGTQGATGEYAKLVLKADPETSVRDAQMTAAEYMSYAVESMRHVDFGPAYIWLRNRIEQAWEEYLKGRKSLVSTGLAKDKSVAMAHLGDAATHFCKAQVYAQHARTKAEGL